MQVAGIRRIGDRAERIEVGELRPLTDDWVLLTVMAVGMGNWHESVRTGGWDGGARPPMALGVEAADTVMAAGRAVRGSHVLRDNRRALPAGRRDGYYARRPRGGGDYAAWYAPAVLGGALDQWAEVATAG